MSNWYSEQFGDSDKFAVSVSFGRDPHPTGDDMIDAGWGGLAIWARGRCLTLNVSDEGGTLPDVRWSLIGILQWLIDVGVRLVNEEPFPDAIRMDQVRDACDWFNEAEQPLVTMTGEEEDEWFLRRSDWRKHHALLRAADDVALPNLMIRRLGDFLEVSWDNETWAAPRPDLSFVEKRGTEVVSAPQAAFCLREALIGATQALAAKYELPELTRLAVAAQEIGAGDDDWQWLIHAQTARVIKDELGSLRERLAQHTTARRSGLYIPHAPETLVLRQARLVSADEVRTLLDAAKIVPSEPMKESILNLIHPTTSSTVKPWVEGYERSRDVRDTLGWGNDPAPLDLDGWMRSNNIRVTRRPLSSTIDLVAMRSDDSHGSAVINPHAQLRARREISSAAALGHILFDATPITVDGTWEHWPTAARARAFAAMLLLPEEGVRDVLAGRTNIDASDVRRVMDRFHTGPYATTYHLKNRGFIANDERRVEILSELDQRVA